MQQQLKFSNRSQRDVSTQRGLPSGHKYTGMLMCLLAVASLRYMAVSLSVGLCSLPTSITSSVPLYLLCSPPWQSAGIIPVILCSYRHTLIFSLELFVLLGKTNYVQSPLWGHGYDCQIAALTIFISRKFGASTL